MPRKTKSAERRTQIAEALCRCMAKQGYVNTSVRDIAREAGLGLGLITHYFKSKDEILYTLTDHIFDTYRDRFLVFARGHRNKAPRERLILGIRFIFMKVAGDRDLTKVFHDLLNLSWHDEKLRNSLRRLYRQYREEVAVFIWECMSESGPPSRKAQDLAAFVVSASEGASDQWFLDKRRIPMSRMAQLAYTLAETLMDETD